MSISPILALHIAGGTVGVLSGGASLCFRKGSRLHRQAGIVFAAAMITMAVCAVYLASRKFQPGNIVGGALTIYLVTTAWLTVRHKDKTARGLGWGALLFVVAIASIQLTLGTQAALSATGKKFGYPPGPYFLTGMVALLAAAGDLRVLLGPVLSGTQRLARHLWRMCFALFVASGSIFLARPHLFPVFMRKSGMLIVLSFAPLALMIFWLVRIRITNRNRKPPLPARHDGYAVGRRPMTGAMQ